MLLLIDAGNTRIKWALAAPDAALGEWHASGAALHAELNHLPAHWQGQAISAAIVANVAGPRMRDQLQLMLPTTSVTWFASTRELAGVRNGYRHPAQLGCDRFAALIGARALVPGQPLIVATCGTATTVDAIKADGRFEGGMILPGLGLMAAALAKNTAQLPQVAHLKMPPLLADNTDEAIVSGCLSAQAGAIERAFAHAGARLCILSGGAAPAIAPALAVTHRMVDNIVLVGLHAAANERKPTC